MHESDIRTTSVVDELIGEYLEALERDLAPDVASLLDRAGEHREELQRWIFAHRAVRRVSESLEPVEEREEPVEVETPTGSRFDQYDEKIAIGEGGMSQVYKARDGLLQRTVALKIIKAESLPSPDAWLLEARALAQLDHPNVVRVHDADVVDGQPYLAMEYVDGWSMHRVLQELSSDEAIVDPDLARLVEHLHSQAARLALALQLARALTTCHDHGILHRDMKPQNVLVTRDGTAKLVDFGLAHYGKHKGKSSLVTTRLYGTPAYLAPEQMQSGQTGQNVRTDIYGLGLVLYELFSLERPPRARLSAPAELPAIEKMPPELHSVLAKCLEAAPSDRYERAAAIVADLECIRDRRPPKFVSVPRRRRAVLFGKRNRGLLAAASVVLVALLAWGGLRWSQFESERSEFLSALGTIDLSVTPAGDNPVAAALSLRSFRDREAEAAQLDQRFWSFLASAPLEDELAEALSSAGIVVSRKLQAEADASAGRIWIRHDWLHAARELTRYETPFESKSLMSGALERAGTYFFEIPDTVSNSALGLEVWAQAWKEQADKAVTGGPIKVKEISTDLEPAARLGVSPINAESEGEQRLALAGRFSPGRQYRTTLISREQSSNFYEVDIQAFGDRWPKTVTIAQPILANVEKIHAGTISLYYPRFQQEDELIDHEVGAFWAQIQPVTWKEFRAFCNSPSALAEFPELADEYAWLESDTSYDDDPALVQWWLASAFARWKGARLPTLFEVMQMRADQPEVGALPPRVRHPGFKDEDTDGEWVAEIDPAFKEMFRFAAVESWVHRQAGRMGGKPYYFMQFGQAPLHGFDHQFDRETYVYPGNPMLFRCVRSVEPTTD